MTETINIAVVGSGYWGPNLIRNIAGLPGAALHTVCDINPKALDANARRYPGVHTTPDYAAVLADSAVRGIVLATPAHLHADMTRAAIEAGKHVMVEKPLALTTAEAAGLVEAAAARGVILMVGHVFIYNPAVTLLRRLVSEGALGRMLYVYSARLNLGIVRDDLNAMWNLAPHDFSILNHVLGTTPERVAARGFRPLGRRLEDVAFITLEYPGDLAAHVHVSWLDPGKVRRMTFVGDAKMVVYDDVSQDERIRIFDRGVMPDALPDAYGEFRMITRGGDVTIPRLDTTEPLRAECAHFVECIRSGAQPLTDGWDGYHVVRMLEAAQRSMDADGAPMPL
jgi:predicted dehydrogenase